LEAKPLAQTLNFNIKGLYTYPSDISGVPPGSLAVAKNISLSRLNLAEPRRGFDALANLPAGTDRADKLYFYESQLLAHYGSTLGLYSGGSFSSKGTLSTPSNATSPRSAAMNQNLYLTSSTGVKKLDDTASTIYASGLPKGLHMNLALKGGTGTAVANGDFVAYRYVIARKDANGNVVRGGVSGRAVKENNGGSSKDITVTGYLPSGLDNTHYIELYRTAGSSAEPDDNMQLAYEYPLTNTDITNGYFAIDDIVPDVLLGAALYTSPSQQGIINDNAKPPLARDLAEYRNYLFFADVESVYRFAFTLIATSGVGLVVDDDVVISDGVTTETYTAKATENVASNQFYVDTATSSPSIRIDNTIRSLVNVINRRSSLVYAYLLSTGGTDLPGKVLLESRSLGSVAFTVTCADRPAAFSPQLTSPAGTNQTATNDTYKNGLMFSKPSQPEHVPTKNIFFVGSSDDRIKRIVGLKDSLLIFKEKDGVYRLSGIDENSFSVSLLDSTAKLVSPESVVSLNGLVYGLFESGVCQVSDSSVTIISQPVKDKLLTLFGSALEATKSYTFAIAAETDGKYILGLPQTSDDVYSTYQLIYDVFGDTWVEWTIDARAGGVNPADGKIYYAVGGDDAIRIERKAYDYTDHADFVQESTASAQASYSLTLSGTDDMSVGDILLQGSLQPAYIESIDSNAGTVTIDVDQTYDLGQPIEHLKAIEVEIEWNREPAGNPAGYKHFSEANLVFKRNFVGSATLNFSSDTNPAVNAVTISGPSSQAAWGYGAWGEGVWGGGGSPEPIRCGVPRGNARCNSLTVKFVHAVAYSDFQLSGLALTFNPTSTRTAR
jgi:hypothetical protein